MTQPRLCHFPSNQCQKSSAWSAKPTQHHDEVNNQFCPSMTQPRLCHTCQFFTQRMSEILPDVCSTLFTKSKSQQPWCDTTAVVSQVLKQQSCFSKKMPRCLPSTFHKVGSSFDLLWHNRGCVTSAQQEKFLHQNWSEEPPDCKSRSLLQKCIAVTQPRLCHFESDGHNFSPEWSTEPVEAISQPKIFITPYGDTIAVVSQLSKINKWCVKSLP